MEKYISTENTENFSECHETNEKHYYKIYIFGGTNYYFESEFLFEDENQIIREAVKKQPELGSSIEQITLAQEISREDYEISTNHTTAIVIIFSIIQLIAMISLAILHTHFA